MQSYAYASKTLRYKYATLENKEAIYLCIYMLKCTHIHVCMHVFARISVCVYTYVFMYL